MDIRIFSPPKTTDVVASTRKPLGAWGRVVASFEILIGGLLLLMCALGLAAVLTTEGFDEDALLGAAMFTGLGIGFAISGLALRRGVLWPQYWLGAVVALLAALLFIGIYFG